MDNDTKWFMIGIALMAFAMFGSVGVMEYSKNQCRIAYAAGNHTAEEISKVCK